MTIPTEHTGTVLTQYPLSRSFALDVGNILGGNPRYLTLAQLRELSVPRMVAELQRLPGRPLAIVLEDPTSEGLLPILRLVATASAGSPLLVIDSNLEQRRFTRVGEVLGGVSFGLACLSGQLARWRSQTMLKDLTRRPRIQVRLSRHKRTAAYLNTNLWFGTKAGGSVGHISGVANALMGHGYKLDYFTVGGRLMINETARHVELSPPRVFGLPYEANLYRFDHAFQAQVAPQIDPSDTAFLYQRLSICNFSGVRLSRALQVPLVVEYNGSEVWIAANWGKGLRYPQLAAAAEAETLRHAHVIVTISDVLRDELLSRGVEPERIVSYPNCVDPAVYDPGRFSADDISVVRMRENLPPQACVASFVGTFGPWHGAEVFAEAIRALCIHNRDSVESTRLHFLFVGDGARLPAVQAILSDPACRPFVRFAGLVPQAAAPAYLAASDILVSPHVPNGDGTRFFGSPTKLFEYMAMAKAIVASDLDQVGDVLRNSIGVQDGHLTSGQVRRGGHLGMLVPPADATALATGLLRLADRPDLRAELGNNARNEALSKYTWSRHVAAILERLEVVASD